MFTLLCELALIAIAVMAATSSSASAGPVYSSGLTAFRSGTSNAWQLVGSSDQGAGPKFSFPSSSAAEVDTKEFDPFDGIDNDQEIAQTRKKAEAGDPDARMAVAGWANTDNEALEWYVKIANDSSRYGCGANSCSKVYWIIAIHYAPDVYNYDMGDAHTRGRPNPPLSNYNECLAWLKKAALADDGGELAAFVYIGDMYRRGKGIVRDYQEAAKWFAIAASRGDPDGEYWYATLLADGLGVEMNIVEAYKWASLAAADSIDNVVGEQLLDRVEKTMTPGQIATAQSLARTWRAP